MTDADVIVATMGFIVALVSLHVVTTQMVITKQQRTIDALTSKLMAKDYREYFTSKAGTQGGKEAKMEQLSWYDDPHEVKEEKT